MLERKLFIEQASLVCFINAVEPFMHNKKKKSIAIKQKSKH